MPSIRNLLSATLLLALLSPVLAYTPSQFTKDQETESDIESFQKLLDQVDPPSLHAALHDYSPKKFKHGMFQEDRNAVKAIHVTEPKAAHSIIELAKRQNQGISNGTLPTSAPPQASSPGPASTSDHVATPVPPIVQGSTLVPASSSSAVGSSSSAPTSSAVATSSATSFAPTTTFSSSFASSTPANTSASASSSLTTGQVITTTDSSGHIIVSTIGGGVQTITPSGSSSAVQSSTSTTVRTTTLPDGSQSTITAVTVVQAGNGAASTPAGNAGASSTKAGSSPGLQTGEAVMSRGFGKEGMAVLVGALGFAAMM